MNNQTIDVASKELWERAKTICLSLAQSPETRSQTERYLSMITTVAISDGCFVIFTSNKFASETIEAQCGESIKRALDLAGGDKEMKLAFKVDVTQKPSFVLNGTGAGRLYLDLLVPAQAEVYDTFGTHLETVRLAQGPARVDVPVSGYLKIARLADKKR